MLYSLLSNISGDGDSSSNNKDSKDYFKNNSETTSLINLVTYKNISPINIIKLLLISENKNLVIK